MATREQTYPLPDSHERVLTQILLRAYSLNWEVIAYTLIFVVAVLTRFVNLGARVMSHDESLHTYYSWRLYEYGEYVHTPLMHGPVLFHMVAFFYFLFGDNDFTARIYPAVLGVLIVMFPLLLRRWLGRIGAVIASVLLLISPMMMYYNRYIREDTPSVFFTVVMVYALLQYIDGERPRRTSWLWLMSAALLLTLASKEVAFIYIAIFGGFLGLFLVLRMVQDVGVRRRPLGVQAWQPPPVQVIVGQVILLAVMAVIIVTTGRLIRFLLSPIIWLPSNLWIQMPLALVLYAPLALSGVVRGVITGGRRQDGAASAIMRWLSDGRSALQVIVAGLVIGVLVALLIICVIDVIRPDQVWTQTTVRSANDQLYGANVTKEYAVAVGFDSTLFFHLLTWIGLPVLVLLFVLFLTAVFRFPGDLPLPWRAMLVIVLIAFITASVLVMFERRSFVSNAGQEPFAASLNVQTQAGGQYNNTPIIAAWILGAVITLGVLITCFLTNWWDFLNRQPVFDVLIVIGTLVLPWLAAFPLFWAGYNLEDYNWQSAQGHDTLQAAISTVIPFFLVSASIGLSWNWRRWIPAMLLFMGLFAFFFTTVFSNGYGLVTGMIGSLGYWLAQQGVRRGSQPQYYYVLTQLPVYEFLPLIGSLLAGVAGLSELWGWRRDRARAALQAQMEAAAETGIERPEGEELPPGAEMERPEQPSESTAETLIAAAHRTQVMQSGPPGGDHDGDDQALPGVPGTGEEQADAEYEQGNPGALSGISRALELPPRLTRAFDWTEELVHRADDPEWVGAFPFLALIGWWAAAIILGLTIAGEKMPWLTVHMTMPLALISGWWLGRVVTGVRWRALDVAGWLVLLVAMPLALLGLAQVMLGFWRGGPFQGRDVTDLIASGNWIAALLIFLGALYVVGRYARRIGLSQVGRMAVLAGAAILAVLTLRVALLASFINYDYATEFLVYAHSGPAVKTVLNEVNRIAQITNEGTSMRIVFDDESSWPFTWYFRDYQNYGYLRGEAGSVDPATLDGARIVVVGSKKAGDVRRILGDRYYEFDYIRLWWPMQEYFNLNYSRVANVFSLDPNNIAAKYYRKGIWDIWWRRDYLTYSEAMCIEPKQSRCSDEANQGTTPTERQQFRDACQQAVVAECANDQQVKDRFAVNQWPVSDRMYFFVDKQIAAQVWDAGIGSNTVNIRAPQYPEDLVYRDIAASAIVGADAGLKGPRGIVVDSDGTLYITDTDHSRIAVLDANGALLRTIGDPATSPAGAGLNQPWGLDLGLDGNLYVADTWNNRVAVFTKDGQFLRAWGHEGVPQSDASTEAMWGPRDLKFGPDGNLYLADTGGKRIRVYKPDGTFVRDIGSGGSGLGQVDEPVGLGFNPISHDLYVAEAWNRRVQVFDPTGLPLRTFNVNMWFNNRQSYNRPYLAVSPDGTLIYVTDMDDKHRVVAYNLDGQPVFSFNQPDDLQKNILGVRSPAGLAFDKVGRLYVVDAEQAKVFIFPPSDVSGGIAPVAPPQSAAPGSPGQNPEATAEVTQDVTDVPSGG
jgi:predicted membrane-bound mannosyltransferase/DNA-binding beta-propeller fold protein YncE